MALRTTALTPVPLNPSGTLQQPTWGEGNAPYATPPELGPGFGSQVLSSETLNYNFQQPTSVLRALMDRSVLSDEGLFTTCVVRQGAWNTGAATLNVTLAPTRLVIDVAQTGGAVLELFATAGDPEVLPALSDSYVDIKDDGTVTVVSVANAAPEPALTVDSVRTYVLVTDATELTSAVLKPEVAPFPCLGPTIGISQAFVGELTVTGALSCNSLEATTSVDAATLDTTGLATLGGLQVDGDSIVGEDGTNTLGVLATAIFGETINAPLGIQAAAAVPVVLTEGAEVPAGLDLGVGAGGTITGDKTVKITLGMVDLIDSDGVIITGEVRMLEKSPPFALGSVSYDGRALALGNAIGAPRLSQPLVGYVPGPVVQAAAIADTGAAASLNMRTGEKARISASMLTQNTIVGPNTNQQITANAVILGASDKIFEPDADPTTSVGWSRVIVYTHAAADASVSFKLRHGSTAGSTTAKDITLSADHI